MVDEFLSFALADGIILLDLDLMKTILILVNHDIVVYYFRLELIQALINAGYKIIISCPREEKVSFFEDMGCSVVDTHINRRGKNPISDISLFISYLRIIKSKKPDLVLTYTIKPNIYGGIACSLLSIPYIENITGISEVMYNTGLINHFVLLLNWISLRKVNIVFFQNKSNLRTYINQNIVNPERCKLIPGSGVNLQKFQYREYPGIVDGITRFLFIGRILPDKGIRELLIAAKSLFDEGLKLRCDFAGILVDDSYRMAFESFSSHGIGSYLGISSNVSSLICDYHAVILPSYHEGMANVLLEAAATGRPVLASNIPGCEETFDEDITGIGFKPKDHQALKEAMRKFLFLDYEEKRAMGIAARRKVENEFDRNIVVAAYMNQIENILVND